MTERIKYHLEHIVKIFFDIFVIPVSLGVNVELFRCKGRCSHAVHTDPASGSRQQNPQQPLFIILQN